MRLLRRDRSLIRLREDIDGTLDRQGRLLQELAGRDDGLHELAEELALLRAQVARLSVATTAGVVEPAGTDREAPALPSDVSPLIEAAQAMIGDGDRVAIVVEPDGTPPAGPEWLAGFPSSEVPDGSSLVAQLEALRGQLVRFLVVPESSSTWFDRRPGFARWVSERFPVAHRDERGGLVYDLTRRHAVGVEPSTIAGVLSTIRARLGLEPAVLDWGTELDIERTARTSAVFSPPGDAGELPYLGGSVDVVVLPAGDEARVQEARRVASRAVVLVSGGEPVRFHVEWLQPAERSTSVSIVIPVYDGVALTDACLSAVRDTLPDGFEGEVIVVDDASTDETAFALERWSRRDHRIRVIRNPHNAGFIESCNRGAASATGDLLIFLNNDTVPLPGWVEALVETFGTHPDAGAVGGMLVYPDGRLQEAGGVIFSDGSGANFGRGDRDLDYPLYNYLRPVDYCSGALLATRRDLFADLGGFDARYSPAYYEDSDYCFGVRRAGLEVYYQPRSAIVHFEGATSGTDPAQGVKRYQAVNREKFVAKWARSIRLRPDPPSSYGRSTWHRLAVREAS